jgi:hypothetical protein
MYFIHRVCLVPIHWGSNIFSTSSVPYVKSNGGITISVVTMRGDKRESGVSFSDQSLMQSISVDDDLKPRDLDLDALFGYSKGRSSMGFGDLSAVPG